MEQKKLVEMMKALGDDTRFHIVSMLGSQEMCACEILSAFHLTQPTLSHHMKTLCLSGLVHCQKSGKWNHYTLNMENFHALEAFFGTLRPSVSHSCSRCED